MALIYKQDMMHRTLPANWQRRRSSHEMYVPGQTASAAKVTFQVASYDQHHANPNSICTPILTQTHLACSGILDSQLQPQRLICELDHLSILSTGRDGERLKSDHLTCLDRFEVIYRRSADTSRFPLTTRKVTIQ